MSGIPKEKDRAEPLVLQGNEACAIGALRAGCRFFAGYPITPSTEVIEYLAKKMPLVGGVFIQMEDEIGSACAIIGARWGGCRAMTATSGPGFSLMQEAIGFAAVTETPIVIVDVQRGGPSTGQPTMSAQQDVYQARYGSHGDYEIIALAPSSVQEMYDFTIRAFGLSERYRTPVIILSDEIVGHMRENVSVTQHTDEGDPPDRGDIGFCSPIADFFTGRNSLVEGQLHNASGERIGHLPNESGRFIAALNDKIRVHADEIADVEAHYMEDANIAFIAYGSVARSAMTAVQLARGVYNAKKRQGFSVSGIFRKGLSFALHDDYRKLKVGLIKVNTLWPFPENALRKLTRHTRLVVVPEMNVGRYVREIERVLPGVQVLSYPKCGGEIHTPQELLDQALSAIGAEGMMEDLSSDE